MRYEDASNSFSNAAAETPDARNDADALAAGSRGPATGNTITGAGTITGVTGADIVANGPGQIVALEGAGGSDTAEGGSLSVEGRFGELTMDSRGSYSYKPNDASPNGGQDVFRYTLQDSAGARDTATLTIDIGREAEKIDANAQQLIVGPDGVVTLPPGVELSDVQVVGRNLVINMPDGSQMVIVDGAVFVPQLVLNGVEVPASNLAALLIDSEPKPASGTPLSSGGNFAVDVPPLDPGVPLGDLIPPTELVFTPPEFQDIGQFEDEEPEITIQPDGQPASIAAVDSVDESGLPARNGNLQGEPAGSNAAASSETTTGTILIDSPDGPSVVSINNVAVTSVGQVFVGTYGTLTVTSISGTAIGYSYTLTDNTNGNTTQDNFSVSVTDNDGDVATATLAINIVDDVPTARNDTDGSAAGVATGNVMTGVGTTSGVPGADTVGADNATLTSVSGTGGSDSTFAAGVLNVNGTFGSLAIDAQGNYTYTVNPNAGGGGVDVFTYTLTDGDGDVTTATLTITNPDLFPVTGPNLVVRTDDDAVVGAGGNPGGVGDDVDAENLSGTLSGSGGDGARTFDLLLTGAPAGFTYVDGPGGSVLVQQGGVTVLTITINAATGAYTVTQNAPIDHPAGADENNVAFTINYNVTDVDGDAASGTLTINVDDDTPVITGQNVNPPALTVDETNLATNASGNFSNLFAVSYGADGPGTTTYAVSVVNGTDSGLDDVATGLDILLFNNAGVVEGRVGGVNGAVAFTVTVNAATGVVTLDQIRALEHPNAANPDDSVSPTASSIQFTVNAVDGDGDPVSQTVNIGANLTFKDDGPSVSSNGAQPSLTVDETVLATNASANFASAFGVSFGADGAGSVSYALGVNAGATGLIDTATGLAVVLTLEGSQVVGRAGPGGAIVFTVSVDAGGNVTLDQVRAVVHDDPTDHDEATSPATLSADNLITLNAIVTDRDGDTATGTINIGQNLNFEDDGPSLSNVQAGSGVTLDETTAGSPGGFPISLVSAGAVISATAAFGADGAAAAGSVVYGISLTGGVASLATSLTTAIGDFPITLVRIDADTIQGQYQNGGTQVAFTVQMNADGTVTLTQNVPLEHLVDGPEGPAHDDALSLSGLINATITIKDGDGDTATASAPIGGNLVFEDDGPSITPATEQPMLIVDETVLGTNASASFAGAFTINYGADGAAAAPSVSYALGVNAGATGIVDTATNEAVVLTLNGSGQVEGRTATTNLLVFTVTVDGSGNVTLDQVRAVVHNDPADHDEPGASAVTLAADNLITLTATATDSDGDTDSAVVNIGQNLQFEDDGPDAQVNGQAALDTLVLDETRPLGTETDGDSAPAGLAVTTANFADNFVAPINYGADGAGTVGYSLVLNGANVNSGLYAVDPADTSAVDGDGYGRGTQIVLNQSGNLITGSANGVDYFTIAINPVSGEVTFTQLQPIWHANTASDDDTSTLTAVAGSLLVRQTVTDKDGDSDTASVDVSAGVFQIEDDGPVAINDADSITAGGTTAQGNVITGVGTTGGTADDVGADVPGKITAISGTGGTDTTFTAGLLSVAGTHGTLTIDANGNYTYTRDAGAPGNVQDVFTYTLTDADGDSTTATLTISVSDAAPNLPDPATVQLDDDALAGGNPGGIDDDANSAGLPGQLVGSGGDGDLDYAFTGVNTLPAGFTVNPVNASTVQILQGATVVLTVTLDTETGAFNVVQNSPIIHPNGANENNLAFSIGVEVVDADGDKEPAAITINVDDDTPTVSALGAQPTLVVDETVLATNDTKDFSGIFTSSFGADGAAAANATVYTLGINAGATGIVDTGTNEAVVLTLNGSGQVEGRTATTNLLVFTVTVAANGNVTLDQVRAVVHNDPTDHDESGASAVTLAADNLITLTKTVTDKDGDSASATANIGQNLQFEDDGPTAAVVTTGFSISHDETPGVQLDANDVAGPLTVFDGLANKGDDPDVAGTVIGFATSTGSIGSTGSSFGADGAGTTAFSLNVSAAGVDSGLNTTEGQDILLYKEGALIVGRVGSQAGPAAFALSIDPVTGQVSLVQYLSIQHPNALNPDDSVSIANGAILAVSTVTDKDGDVSTASTGIGNLISFQDDGPQAIQPDAIASGLDNEAGATAKADLDDDGEVLTDFGADGPGLVTFANIVNGQDTNLTSGGDAIEYFLTNNGQTLEARTNGAAGELIFTVAINQATGEYTVTIVQPIDNGAGVSFDNLTSTSAGNALFRGVGADDPATTVDLLLSAEAGGAAATINTDSDSIGSANQSMDAGETVRIDFVTNLREDTTAPLTPSGFNFDGHVSTNSFLGFIPQVQGSQANTVSFTVYALDTTATDTSNPDRDPTGGFSDSTITQITEVTVIGFDAGQSTPVTLDISGLAVGGTYNVAYGISVTKNADGSVTFNGIQEGDQYGFSTGANDFNAVAVAAHGSFDLGVFSIGQVDSGDPINLTYDLQIVDGDGDAVVVPGAINITIDPAGTNPPAMMNMMVSQEALVDDTSSTQLVATNDDQQLQKTAANNNSVLLGAIAAAGLGTSSLVAAETFAPDSQATSIDPQAVSSSNGSGNGNALGHGNGSRSALNNETQEALDDQPVADSSAKSSAQAADNSLTDSDSAPADTPTALSQGTEMEASEPAQSTLTSASVAMPSAEMLQAANSNEGVAGQAKSNGEVGRVLADALDGGAGGANIDAVIQAVANQGGGGQASIEALATPGAGGGSAWDTPALVGFTGAHSALTMDAMVAHPDAVQTAA